MTQAHQSALEARAAIADCGIELASWATSALRFDREKDEAKEFVNAGPRSFQELAKIEPARRVAYWAVLGVKDYHGESRRDLGAK